MPLLMGREAARYAQRTSWTPPPSAIASPTSSSSIRPSARWTRRTSSRSRRTARVRFHEGNEFILWQGEPHKLHVFVIQQGTVSLWDESGGEAELRDVRGAGDMLGIERFNGARSCLHSARSASDVVIYAFPAADFEALAAEVSVRAPVRGGAGTVTPDFRRTDDAQIRSGCSCTTLRRAAAMSA